MSEKLHRIAALVDLMRRHGIDAFELSSPDEIVKFSFEPTGHASAGEAAASSRSVEADMVEILSPGVGTLVARHPAMSAELVTVGQTKQEGECVALIQSGRIYRPVVVPVEGTIVKRLANPGDVVDHARPLFLLKRGKAV
ncbi:biotin/lipoyl-containing protein [Bradyrhizobium sp.]|jgi:biotin carboxyl carrier protein|uniref:biotin/lipoyl-containing protein n=1 Tax=Bradyrhizobium sp. TaxID=376 RepID=UPI002DDD10D2|nr:biotin/lipoyl-containing protein [Bradyrhizobium sp.]HEV2159907.1 biotin/lipoyl-containing protein [Bradyrhizobium sp.]